MSLSDIASILNTIKTLGEAANHLISLPKNEREEYRKALLKTCIALDQAILLPWNRLSTILEKRSGDPNILVSELRRLDNFHEWKKVEQDVCLCEPLRNAGDEMGSMKTRVKDKLSIHDVDTLSNLINEFLQGETGIADQIRRVLRDLSSIGLNSDPNASLTIPANFEKAKEEVRKKRDELDDVHYELIKTHIKIREALKA